MYPSFISVENNRFYWRHSVDVSDDVTTTKAVKRVTDKMFYCFDTSMSTRDS